MNECALVMPMYPKMQSMSCQIEVHASSCGQLGFQCWGFITLSCNAPPLWLIAPFSASLFNMHHNKSYVKPQKNNYLV
jgi:hypothetical protein